MQNAQQKKCKMLNRNYRCGQKPAIPMSLQKCLSESRTFPINIPFSSWTCHIPGTIQGLFIASVKTPGQSRTIMESLLSLVSPHSAAELSSPDPSLTSARSQQLLKESRKCNLRNDPSYPGWFYAIKALRSFLFPLRSFLVPILPLSLKSWLDLQNLCLRGHWMLWTAGDWSLLFSPHFLADTEAKVLQVQAGIDLPVPNPHLLF